MSTQPSPRLLSLDAFRGMVIVLMFLVNVAGHDESLPEWFREWFPHRGYNNGHHGNGVADFVFPWFLFIVGCAVPFSMASGRGKGRPYWKQLLSSLRRGVTIYLLGTLMWCAVIGYDPKRMIDAKVFLHWDILPLIGFGYVMAVLCAGLPRWGRIGVVTAVLLFKAASLTMIPHPEVGQVVWTDKQSYDQYLKGQFGWFGVLITQGLAAGAIVVLGSIAVEYIRDQTLPAVERVQRMMAWGAVLVVASYIAHRTALPYSKDFLTSSYVMLMAGSGAMVLAAMYWIIDVKQATTMTFLRIYGMNAIAIYVLAELMWKTALIRWSMVTPWGEGSIMIASLKAWLQHYAAMVVGKDQGQTIGAFGIVAAYILFYWLIAAAMYRAKMFVKV